MNLDETIIEVENSICDYFEWSADTEQASVIRKALKSIATEAKQEERERIMKELPKELQEYFYKMYQAYEGKLPFVVFEGKADEKEKKAIYQLGVNDCLSQVKNIINNV